MYAALGAPDFFSRGKCDARGGVIWSGEFCGSKGVMSRPAILSCEIGKESWHYGAVSTGMMKHEDIHPSYGGGHFV